MSVQLPAYGPTELFEDEGITAHVVVRVAVALSREQLEMALAIAVTNLGADADPDAMTDEAVRCEVEGYFAACGLVELDTAIEEGGLRSYLPKAAARLEQVSAAVARAYPEVAR